MYIPGSRILIFIQKKHIPYRGTIMFLHTLDRFVTGSFSVAVPRSGIQKKRIPDPGLITFFYLNRFGTGPFSFVYLRTGVQKKPVLDP